MDSLTWHVINSLADDWESIAQIRPHIHQYVGDVSDEQIFATLRRLQQDSLVDLMEVPDQPADVLDHDPAACWFGMTDAGRRAWDSQRSKYAR